MSNARIASALLLALSTLALAQSSEGVARRGPPPESLAACTGLAEGTSCGFTVDGRNLTGSCRAGPNKGLRHVCLKAHAAGVVTARLRKPSRRTLRSKFGSVCKTLCTSRARNPLGNFSRYSGEPSRIERITER